MKREIALAIPVSNEHKLVTDNSTEQGSCTFYHLCNVILLYVSLQLRLIHIYFKICFQILFFMCRFNWD